MKSNRLYFLVFILCTIFLFQINTYASPVGWSYFKERGFIGVKDSSGNILVPALYTKITNKDGLFFCKTNTNLYCVSSEGGIMIVPPKYIIVNRDTNENFIVASYMGYGLLSSSGDTLIEDKYTFINPIRLGNHNLYHIGINGFQGIVTHDGSMIINPNTYNLIEIQTDDTGELYFECTEYGKRSTIHDRTGKLVISTTYANIKLVGNFANGHYEVTDGNAKGKLNLKGDIIISPNGKHEEYIDLLRINDIDGQFEYKLYRTPNNKYKLIDKNGSEIIPPLYDNISVLTNGIYGYFKVVSGEYMGLYTKSGNIIISLEQKYNTIGLLSTHIVTLDDQGKETAIDYNGKILSPSAHLNVGVSYIQKDTLITYSDAIYGNLGIKNTRGDIILQPIYDDFNFLQTFSRDTYYIMAFYNGFIGLYTKDGKLLYNPEYTSYEIEKYNNNYIYIRNGNYVGVGTTDGTIIIPPEMFTAIKYQAYPLGFVCSIDELEYVYDRKGKLLSVLDIREREKADENQCMGDTKFEEGNYNSAISYYSLAIDYKPTALLLFNRGASYYNLQKFQLAINDFEKCLKLSPSKRIESQAVELIESANYYINKKVNNGINFAYAVLGCIITNLNSTRYSSCNDIPQNRTGSSSVSGSANQSSRNISTKSSTDVKQNKCGFCGGKGSIIEYTSNYGINTGEYCETCNKKVNSGHYHKTCIHCNGTGLR